MRGANDALGGGEHVALTATSDAAAAYLRRAGDRVVLVIANLGTTALSGATVASPDRAVAAGRYTLVSLLGGPAGQALRVAANGRIQGYRPLPSIGPLEIHVLELARAR